MLLYVLIILGFIACIAMSYDILFYFRKTNREHRQRQEILSLIKQDNNVYNEPIFSYDIRPDFSGYLKQGE